MASPSSSASSGTTALATSGNTAVTALAAPGGSFKNLIITNTGSAAGFFSFDAGTTWHYLTAALNGAPGGIYLTAGDFGQLAIQIKRISGGTDLSGVYVSLI